MCQKPRRNYRAISNERYFLSYFFLPFHWVLSSRGLVVQPGQFRPKESLMSAEWLLAVTLILLRKHRAYYFLGSNGKKIKNHGGNCDIYQYFRNKKPQKVSK